MTRTAAAAIRPPIGLCAITVRLCATWSGDAVAVDVLLARLLRLVHAVAIDFARSALLRCAVAVDLSTRTLGAACGRLALGVTPTAACRSVCTAAHTFAGLR